MEDVYFPVEKAVEPVENARQPTMNAGKDINKKTNVTFKEVEEEDESRSKRVYKSILSQPADNTTHLQKILWLQKRRTEGLWVQCDSCDRWRYLPGILDRFELPNKWYCKLNPDKTMAECSIPEVPITKYDEEDLIHSEYSAGSVVLARLAGWPWWPAMVDDDPDTEQFYWLDGFSDIPTHYNVVFFDTEITRAWIAPDKLKPYIQNKKTLKSSLKNKAYKKRLEVGMAQADDAVILPLEKRLEKYSFVNRYKGSINSPINITTKHAAKFQKHLKRKFNIDLPDNFFESDDEETEYKETMKRSNVTIVGSKNNNLNDNVNNSYTNEDSNTDTNNRKSSLVVQVGSDKEGQPNEGENKSTPMYNEFQKDQRVPSYCNAEENNNKTSSSDGPRPGYVQIEIIEDSTNYNNSGSPRSDDFDF